MQEELAHVDRDCRSRKRREAVADCDSEFVDDVAVGGVIRDGLVDDPAADDHAGGLAVAGAEAAAAGGVLDRDVAVAAVDVVAAGVVAGAAAVCRHAETTPARNWTKYWLQERSAQSICWNSNPTADRPVQWM